MDTRTKFGEADAATLRAFVELYNRVGDQFHFPIDHHDEDDSIQELRAGLTVNDNFNSDGRSTFTVTGIEMMDGFETVREAVGDLGVTVIDEERGTKSHEDYGDYDFATVTAYAEDGIEETWNQPTMLFYGSLTPELEEAVYATLGNNVEAMNIRNHVAVRGENISDKRRSELSDHVKSSSRFFDDDARFISQKISTGTVA